MVPREGVGIYQGACYGGMMEKDFDAWNQEKKILQSGVKNIFCHPRERWWRSIGVNVGFEQDGTGQKFDRPLLVIHVSRFP